MKKKARKSNRACNFLIYRNSKRGAFGYPFFFAIKKGIEMP